MADQEGGSATQADAQGQQQGQQSQADGSQTQAQGDEGARTFDAEYVKQLRAEAASWRTQAQQHKKRLEDIERGQMSDMEKLAKERDELKAERDALNAQVRTAQVVSIAAKSGAVYPDAVARLVPADAEDVEAALKQIRKDYPAMFRTQNGSADAGAGTQNGRPPLSGMNDLIRQAAGRG